MSQESFKNFRTKVFDLDEGTGKLTSVEKTITFEGFEDEINGKVITKKAAQNFVMNYWASSEAQNPSKTVAVVFNKRILTLLLAQKRCESIRFYFALNSEGEQTLVLVGANSYGNDLGADYETVRNRKSIILDNSDKDPDMEDTIIVEVGGGNGKDDFMDKDGNY